MRPSQAFSPRLRGLTPHWPRTRQRPKRPQAPKATTVDDHHNSGTCCHYDNRKQRSSSAAPSASKQAQVNSIVSSGEPWPQVMASSNKENARLAKNYDKYLAEVANSSAVPGLTRKWTA
jgi:histone deacetylase complex regulatory component SIN3